MPRKRVKGEKKQGKVLVWCRIARRPRHGFARRVAWHNGKKKVTIGTGEIHLSDKYPRVGAQAQLENYDEKKSHCLGGGKERGNGKGSSGTVKRFLNGVT